MWYEVLHPLDVDFDLFYAGDGSSNPAKLNNLCDFKIKKSCLGEPLLHCFCFTRAGYSMDFDPLLICYVFYLREEKKRTHNIEKRLLVGLAHCVKYYRLC